MQRHAPRHEWDLLQQAAPKTPHPYGYVCSCGETRAAMFRSRREASRAALGHGHHDVSARRVA